MQKTSMPLISAFICLVIALSVVGCDGSKAQATRYCAHAIECSPLYGEDQQFCEEKWSGAIDDLREGTGCHEVERTLVDYMACAEQQPCRAFGWFYVEGCEDELEAHWEASLEHPHCMADDDEDPAGDGDGAAEPAPFELTAETYHCSDRVYGANASYSAADGKAHIVVPMSITSDANELACFDILLVGADEREYEEADLSATPRQRTCLDPIESTAGWAVFRVPEVYEADKASVLLRLFDGREARVALADLQEVEAPSDFTTDIER